MAIYYVRATGNDAQSGTSAGTAWASLTHALSVNGASVAGSTVYVGAGVYRGTNAIGISGAAGSVTAIIGDVDGAQTGDAGEVVVSSYTTNDFSAPSGSVLLAFTTHTYLSFSLLTFVGGGAGLISNSAGGTIGCSFTDCTFNYIGGFATTTMIAITSTTTGAALNITFDRCTMFTAYSGALSFTLTTTNTGSSDWDANVIIRNCAIITIGSGSGGLAVNVTSGGANTYHGGGVRVYNCLLATAGNAFNTAAANVSTAASVACGVYNSLLMGGGGGFNANTAGQVVENFNNLFMHGTAYTNTTAGAGSRTNSAVSGTYAAAIVELGQSYKWAGVYRQFFAPNGASSPLLGYGSAGSGGNYPTVDWANRPRPSGGSSSVAAVGAYERHDFAVEDTVTYNDSPASGKLVGPGDQDIQIPVDAVSSTISIYLYFDSYGGTSYPSATLLANGELGITTQTKTCTSSADSWQQLTFSAITPSKAGWVTIRITSFDTNGTGTVNFDTLSVA